MLAVLAVSTMWGFSSVLIKFLLPGVPPLCIAFTRALLSGALPGPIAMRRGRRSRASRTAGGQLPGGRDWVHLGVVTVLLAALPFGLTAWGQQHVGAALSAVLHASIPLWTTGFAVLLLRHRPRRRQIVGVLVGVIGGAGLACVYNVPLGGAFFTAEILCGSTSIATLLPALACSAIATMTAWIYLPSHATYLNVPDYRFSMSLLVWSLIAGPFIGLAATGYIRVIGSLSHHRITGTAALIAPILAFGVLGLIGIAYPQLFGNGHGIAANAFHSYGTAGLLLTLAVFKPAVTALCVGSGASGGLFTPMMSTGAVFGAGAGILWTQLWPGTPIGAFAMVAAAAAIGSAMQAPLTALVLVLELTHSGFAILTTMITATILATLVVRHLDGYSIYSARLPARPTDTTLIENPGLAS